jgi:hypothetical protein
VPWNPLRKELCGFFDDAPTSLFALELSFGLCHSACILNVWYVKIMPRILIDAKENRTKTLATGTV